MDVMDVIAFDSAFYCCRFQVFCPTTERWIIIDTIFPRDVRDYKPNAVKQWEEHVALPRQDCSIGAMYIPGDPFTETYCPFLFGCADGVDHDPLSSLGPFCPQGCSCLWCSIKARKAQDNLNDVREKEQPQNDLDEDHQDQICGHHPLSPQDVESTTKRQKSKDI
jgi:hypothetical protein